jgi:hypothetical protein
MVLLATAAFGLRWSCGVRSIGLKFIIESRHLSLVAADQCDASGAEFSIGHADAQARDARARNGTRGGLTAKSRATGVRRERLPSVKA